MNDQELEEALQKIYQGELEMYREEEMEETLYEWHDLRPPALAQDIAECEQFLGRTFSPSYR